MFPKKRIDNLFLFICNFLIINVSRSFLIITHQKNTFQPLISSPSHSKQHCLNAASRSDTIKLDDTSTKKYQNINSFHLVSLASVFDTSPQSLRDMWRWKDTALGDGRDYFVPRPRAISDFQTLFLHHKHQPYHARSSDSRTDLSVHVKECAILSNCARLDVYLVLQTTFSTETYEDLIMGNTTIINSCLEEEAKQITARVFANQLRAYQNTKLNRSALSESLSTLFDLPGVIKLESKESGIGPIENEGNDNDIQTKVKELTNSVSAVNGIENITRHACLVAAGMKDRPSRPGREVPFRPFSSRDAHVMLQMKRTVEVSKGTKLQIILKAALQAGKAARDPKKVPAILPLKSYNSGEGGRYTKPEAPAVLVEIATQAAVDFAIEPAIQKCISNLYAMNSSEKIKDLREKAKCLIDTSSDEVDDRLKKINRILHLPTLELREGKSIDEAKLMKKNRRGDWTE